MKRKEAIDLLKEAVYLTIKEIEGSMNDLHKKSSNINLNNITKAEAEAYEILDWKFIWLQEAYTILRDNCDKFL